MGEGTGFTGTFLRSLAVLLLVATPGLGSDVIFRDSFQRKGNTLNRCEWTTEIGPASFLGRTQLQDWVTPGGIGKFVVGDGGAELALETYNPTGSSLYGTHGKTLMSFRPGFRSPVELTARVTLNSPLPGGAVFGIYFYGCIGRQDCSAHHNEIDIELVTNWLQPGAPDKVQLNHYADEPLGAGHGHVANLPAGFDPLAPHDWTIVWSLAQIDYLVDGTLLFSATDHVPTGPMQVNMIAWGPGPDWSDAYDASLQPVGSPAQNQRFYASVRNVIVSGVLTQSSLLVDFGAHYGIWMRRGTAWCRVHPYSAKAMLRVRSGNHDAMVFDFGPGVGVWFWQREVDGDEVWFQINPQSPTAMAGVDADGNGDVESAVFTFAGQGVWFYDSDTDEWTQIHPFDASQLAAADLDGDGGEDVIFDFPGYGLWVLYGNGTWAQLHPFDATAIVVADLDGNGRRDVVVNFPGWGVWAYRNGRTWSQVHGLDATRLAAGDLDGNGVSDLVIDFGAVYGVWTLKNGTTWAQLHGLTTEGITTGDLDGNGHDDVILDFGAPGIWANDDVNGWEQLHGFNPKAITTGRFF